MFDKYESERFGNYISTLREKRKVNIDQLAEGLCSVSMLGRFEKGERLPAKMLRDRLINRLGEAPGVYENFLDADEYEQCTLRQQILVSIIDWKREKTEKLLETYREKYDETNPLEKQFLLTMEAQWKRRDGATREELAELFEETVKQSVPNVDSKSITGMCLSMQEVDLVLEYEHYRKDGRRKDKYEEIMEYILHSGFDENSKAKTYPKAVYYLCLELENEKEQGYDNRFAILEYCNQAIEILRDAHGLYYLWELLKIRDQVLQELITMYQKTGESTSVTAFLEQQQETEEWLEMFGSLSKEFDVPVTMSENCYLYMERGVYCIGDVIRIRRKMFGMSREQLCEGICSLKTIGRIENNKMKTQRQIVRELFERLHMSCEYQRTELITDNPEAQQLFYILRTSINDRQYEKVKEILERVKQLVPMDIPYNRQSVERMEVVNEWQKGKMSDDFYIKRTKEILGYTLPYDIAIADGPKYMTYEEITSVREIMGELENDENEIKKCMDTLDNIYVPYEKEGIVGVHLGMYGFIMSEVASELGNKGEYSRSDEISRIIIRESLHAHIVPYIYMELYNLLWNYEQKVKEHIPVAEKRDVFRDLKYCIVLSRFCKYKYRETDYKMKLEQRKNSLESQ